MRELKALVLIITLVTGIFGVLVTDTNSNSTNLTTGEYAAYDVDGVTEFAKPSVTPIPSPEFLASTILAPVVDQQEPGGSEETDTGSQTDVIEIPEIVVAEFDDVEDPQPNKTQNEGTVTIQKEEILPTATPKPENGDNDGESEYTKTVKIGIDVSKWNGDVDWAKVAASGVEFAIIRTGYRGSSTGKIVADPRFYENIEGALANGIEVGVYFYSQAINEQEAIQEAAWVCEIIKNYNITYPVAYDLEEVTYGRIKDCTYAQFNANARAFLDYVNSKGYRGSLYSCKSYLEDLWDTSLFAGDHIWLAHYTKQTSYTGRYDMWQYTDSGKVDGISTSVDLNYAYFYEKNENSGGSEVTPTPEPTPEATPSPEITEEVKFTAVDEQCVVVLSDGTLNVRETASSEAAVLGSLENGAVVRRTGISENGWSEIEYNGAKAYASSAYLQIYVEATPEISSEVTPEVSLDATPTATPEVTLGAEEVSEQAIAIIEES
ncbi:MAG: SH3 domain-containing protein [Lachnospiraceae bacterium]|nr:SH3 domain-containing protein [Lachnospiraceae bacterium]